MTKKLEAKNAYERMKTGIFFYFLRCLEISEIHRYQIVHSLYAKQTTTSLV